MALDCVEPRQMIVFFFWAYWFLFNRQYFMACHLLMWCDGFLCAFSGWLRSCSVFACRTVRCREVLKWLRCLTYRAVHAGVLLRTLLQIPGTHIDMQRNVWFVLGQNANQRRCLGSVTGRMWGGSCDKSKSHLRNRRGEGFFYRHVMKIRVVASWWLGSFASDKCGYMKKIRISK